jgi:hypothetical protein
MALLEDLAAGTLGLVVEPPPRLVPTKHTATSVAFSDPVLGLGWWFYFFPDVHLALEPGESLQRDVHRHTRLLFDTMFAHDAPQLPSDARPRTADAAWTPVVEIEPFVVAGTTALTVLHRMHYRPMRESVMGHTLVPVAKGLFEAAGRL